MRRCKASGEEAQGKSTSSAPFLTCGGDLVPPHQILAKLLLGKTACERGSGRQLVLEREFRLPVHLPLRNQNLPSSRIRRSDSASATAMPSASPGAGTAGMAGSGRAMLLVAEEEQSEAKPPMRDHGRPLLPPARRAKQARGQMHRRGIPCGAELAEARAPTCSLACHGEGQRSCWECR